MNELTICSRRVYSKAYFILCNEQKTFTFTCRLQSRVCVQQCKIGPYTFKKDVGVIFDTWSLHYDHEIWGSDVKQFRPDRFQLVPASVTCNFHLKRKMMRIKEVERIFSVQPCSRPSHLELPCDAKKSMLLLPKKDGEG